MYYLGKYLLLYLLIFLSVVALNTLKKERERKRRERERVVCVFVCVCACACVPGRVCEHAHKPVCMYNINVFFQAISYTISMFTDCNEYSNSELKEVIDC